MKLNYGHPERTDDGSYVFEHTAYRTRHFRVWPLGFTRSHGAVRVGSKEEAQRLQEKILDATDDTVSILEDYATNATETRIEFRMYDARRRWLFWRLGEIGYPVVSLKIPLDRSMYNLLEFYSGPDGTKPASYKIHVNSTLYWNDKEISKAVAERKAKELGEEAARLNSSISYRWWSRSSPKGTKMLRGWKKTEMKVKKS